jgi:predicted MFS family arabinose efflux permease
MGGAAVTDLGGGLFLLVGPWLMYDLTRSAFWVGVLAAVQGLMPWAGPLFGWVVDHVDRRRALALAVGGQGAGALVLAVLSATHHATIFATLAAAAVIAAGGRLQLLAGSALRQWLTPVEDRLRVNSWWSLVTLVSSYGAPGLAGFLLEWRGVPAALAVQTAAMVPLLAVALRLPPVPRISGAGGGGAVREAWQHLRRERGIWLYTWVIAFWNWTYAGVAAIMVYFYRHQLHFSAGEVGLVGLTAGVLPVLFAVLSPRLNRNLGPGKVLAGGIMLSGTAMLVLPALSTPWAVGTAVGASDGPIGPIFAALSTMTQARIASRLYGRVTALRQLISMGATPTAGLGAGLLAARVGAGPVIGGLGALTVLGAAVAMRWTPLLHVRLDGSVRRA